MKKYIENDVEHIKNSFEEEDLKYFYKRLKKDVPWRKMEWKAGRFLPRLIYKYGEGIGIEILDYLKEMCEVTFECKVYGMWCNLYRDGSDYTPPHQDNYGKDVITYSFGASRRFVCQNIKTGDKEEYVLEDGDIFYFSPKFDKEHKHSVPKTTKKVGDRISIVMFTSKPYSKIEKGIEPKTYLPTKQEIPSFIITQDGHIITEDGEDVEDPSLILDIIKLLDNQILF